MTAWAYLDFERAKGHLVPAELEALRIQRWAAAASTSALAGYRLASLVLYALTADPVSRTANGWAYHDGVRQAMRDAAAVFAADGSALVAHATDDDFMNDFINADA